jgi:hypothetical protein
MHTIHTRIHTHTHTPTHTHTYPGFLGRLEHTYAACMTSCQIVPNTWTHVAASVDVNGSVSFFINGTLRSVSGRNATPRRNPFNVNKWGVALGRSHPGSYPVGYFTGQIGDVRVWNLARKENEINQTMYEACGGAVASARLVNCFLGEDAGTGTDAGYAVVTQPFEVVKFSAKVVLGDQHLPWCVTMSDGGKVVDPICFK